MSTQRTHVSGPERPLRPGDLVEVKSADEIRQTLDARSTLGELPFMAEMLAYCGQRFVVSKRAEKVCDSVSYTGSRRMPDTVLLEDMRCNGAHHDGCQAECRFFWKEQWLRRVEPGSPAPAKSEPTDTRAFVEELARNSKATTTVGDKPTAVYTCQATAVEVASTHLKVWDPRVYLREYTSGNVELGRLVRVTARAAVEEPMRKLHLLPDVWLAGKPGVAPVNGDPLGLQAGDWVEVKSRDEIATTLDENGKNRGLWFDRELLPHCGKRYRVRQRIDHFIDERDGRMVRLKHCVTLDGVTCTGDLSPRRWLCPRALYPYWRESWLKRASPPAA